jgi:outer membrane protein
MARTPARSPVVPACVPARGHRPRSPVRAALALAVLAALPLAALPARAADLLGLVRDALENDATYGAARFAQLATAEARPQARAGLLPQVTATMGENVTHLHIDVGSTPVNFPTFRSWGPAIQLAMPIYNAQSWDMLAESQLQVEQGEAQLAQARADLLVRVAQGYFDVLAAQDALAALQENKKAVSEQLAQARREFEVGTKTIVDTHEAKARYDQIDAQEQVARGDLLVKQEALRAIVGHDPGPLEPLRDPVTLVSPVPADVESWAHSAEDANLAVHAARAGETIAQREATRARDAYLPRLDFTAGYQYQKSTGSQLVPLTNTQRASTLGLQLSVPVFTGGYIQSKLREARARSDKAHQDFEAAKRLASQQARQAYTGVDYGLAQVHALESAEISSKSQLDSTRLGYQVGIRINLDVLNANTQLFNTRRDLKKARYDFLVNGLKLKAASGSLVEADVDAINGLLARAQ